VSIERQVDAHTLLSVGFGGTQAHHLLVIQEVNPGSPAACLASPGCGPFVESEYGTRTAYGPSFGSVNLQKTIANSHDNALEMSVKHSTRSLFVEVGYTWSKSIDQSSSLAEPVYPDVAGFSNAGMSRALSAFDLTHNFVASYRYTLPVGGGRWSGWEVSGLTRFSSGFPVTLLNNNDTSLLGTQPNGINNNGIDEPELSPGSLEVNHRPGIGGFVFNTALLKTPPKEGTLGDARRRFFYGPGADNTDLALSKLTRLHEGMQLETRVEAFNVFNHSQFFGPAAVNGNVSSADFGKVQSAAPPRLMQLSARIKF
jgi:hypothetical protein